MNAQHVTIVMVEDDDGHARLIERNLRRAGITNNLVHLRDGREAMNYFFPQGGIQAVDIPILLLLDLNLPEVDGFTLLQKIKSTSETRSIPVIVLTTTDNPREVERCYELGCSVYITKPVDYDNFAESIRKLGLLLAIVKIPGAE